MADPSTDGASGGATFHEVVFGDAGSEQIRYDFQQFRELSLRNRVRLLMSMPSVFLSASGEEIPRDAAMRFRQHAPKVASPTSTPSEPEDRVTRLIRLLLESTLEHELRGCVRLAEQLVIEEPEPRAALASGLLRTAKLLEDDHGSTPLSWAAIRRFGSLVPTHRLAELAHFLEPGMEAETMQAALQTIWHALSVDQDFGLAILAVRTRQLLNKYLDVDWLCTPVARALTTDLLLAHSVLTPSGDEAGLRAIYNRAQGLADAIPLDLARAEIAEALSYARANARPIAARLQLIAGLAQVDA
ncbi:hypothetical protein ENSA5_24600 [Enhygromyxa salina]|uniref:Uncharacterized protein n=1 Tax=Enhygromyxa salina TaxID=215803 RepID=A0A2S9YB13_9BACT|nr:hypothetical protein [Enhygromyxa salina]PRQ02307.1 hypothetical protein ENSA5_24600 [Enhygromyxa salina]